MNNTKALINAFNELSPSLPDYISYRMQRAIKEKKNLIAIFQHTTSHLYRKNLKLESPRVVVCTGIANDGLGDLRHAVHVSTILKDHLPSPFITMICSMDNFLKRKKVLCGDVLEAAHRCMFTENFKDDKDFQSSAQKIIDTAEVVVKVATGSYVTDLKGLSIDEVDHPLYFSELGSGYIRGLGFAPQDLGVPIPLETEEPYLDDEDLSDLLTANSRRANYTIHLGYLKENQLQKVFFTICCLTAKAPNASIDIIMPLSSFHMTDIFDDQEGDFFKTLNRLGLRQLSLYTRENSDRLLLKKTIQLNEEGLEVRLINPFPISAKSFSFLSSKGELCQGCTGDFSFLEALLGKNPKIPFYEILTHKDRFFKAFIDLLKTLIPNSDLCIYFESLIELERDLSPEELFQISTSIASIITRPDVGAQMVQISHFLKRHFNFNEVLLDYVSREIAHSRYPQIHKFEQEISTQFLTNIGLLDIVYKKLEYYLQIGQSQPLERPRAVQAIQFGPWEPDVDTPIEEPSNPPVVSIDPSNSWKSLLVFYLKSVCFNLTNEERAI